jgi:hypothetical protein
MKSIRWVAAVDAAFDSTFSDAPAHNIKRHPTPFLVQQLRLTGGWDKAVLQTDQQASEFEELLTLAEPTGEYYLDTLVLAQKRASAAVQVVALPPAEVAWFEEAQISVRDLCPEATIVYVIHPTQLIEYVRMGLVDGAVMPGGRQRSSGLVRTRVSPTSLPFTVWRKR